MSNFKSYALQAFEEQIADKPEWVWKKSRTSWCWPIFKGVEIAINADLRFKYGYMVKIIPCLEVYITEFSRLFKQLGQTGPKYAWQWDISMYFKSEPLKTSIYETRLPGIWDDDYWYTLDQAHIPISKVFNAGLDIMRREFNLSSREAFIDSLIVKDDDPRLDDDNPRLIENDPSLVSKRHMTQVGVINQCLLRMLQGDDDFLKTILERYPDRDELLRPNLEKIQANSDYRFSFPSDS